MANHDIEMGGGGFQNPGDRQIVVHNPMPMGALSRRRVASVVVPASAALGWVSRRIAENPYELLGQAVEGGKQLWRQGKRVYGAARSLLDDFNAAAGAGGNKTKAIQPRTRQRKVPKSSSTRNLRAARRAGPRYRSALLSSYNHRVKRARSRRRTRYLRYRRRYRLRTLRRRRRRY